MDSRQPTDDIDPVGEARLEAEKQFYSRFFKFFLGLMCFFAFMFFTELEHDSALFFVGIVVFGLFLAYMIGALAYTMFVVNPRNDISNILTEEELADMHHDSEEEEEDVEKIASQLAEYPLEDSPRLIRACKEEVVYYNRPKNGRYSVVYNCCYFGKTIRSESQLLLRFQESSKLNGWEITGVIISGQKEKTQTKRPLSEGFINARGEMYWTLANPQKETNVEGIYRGCYDFRATTMYDGEFQAGSAPRGRIVRLELQVEGDFEEEISSDANTKVAGDWGSVDVNDDWGTHDVEMVELDKDFV